MPYAAIALIVGAAVFSCIILATPYVLMAVAINRLSDNGARTNRFIFAPRTTSASRAIVRPSPDLAYAACVFDVSRGPIRVRAAPWAGYMSISVFAANSDNLFAVNAREAPEGVDFILARRGQATPPGAKVVLVPSARGIIVDRRLAPDDASFVRANAARHGDICAPLTDSLGAL